jgi:hypothetical protein
MAVRAGKRCTAPRGVSLSGINAAEIEHLVHSLKPRLESLAGASLLFTGATGWFGTWLLDFSAVSRALPRIPP